MSTGGGDRLKLLGSGPVKVEPLDLSQTQNLQNLRRLQCIKPSASPIAGPARRKLPLPVESGQPSAAPGANSELDRRVGGASFHHGERRQPGGAAPRVAAAAAGAHRLVEAVAYPSEQLTPPDPPLPRLLQSPQPGDVDWVGVPPPLPPALYPTLALLLLSGGLTSAAAFYV